MDSVDGGKSCAAEQGYDSMGASGPWIPELPPAELRYIEQSVEVCPMLTFFLWCILLFFCWPLALVALILYPLVWLFLLPFRIVGIAVDGVLQLLWAIITLPARVLRGPRHA